MGLYSDDWGIFFYPNPFDFSYLRFISGFSLDRPIAIPLYWIIEIGADWSPARIQAFAIALSLLGAFSIGLIARTMTIVLKGEKAAQQHAFWLATALFLVLPWGLGVTGWVSESINLSSILWFAFALRFLLLPGKNTWLSLMFGGALLLTSFLTYEIFYGQASLFVALAWFVARTRPVRSALARAMVVTLLANVIAVTFNRLIHVDAHKTLHTDIGNIFARNYGNFLYIISQSFFEIYVLVIVLSIAALALSLIGLGLAHSSRGTFAFVILTLTGILLGGLLFSLAGYDILALGYASRTLFAFSFYVAVFFGVGLGIATTGRSGFLQVSSCAVAIALIFVFGLATRDRLRDWQDTWTDELDFVRGLPAVPDAILQSKGVGAYFGPGADRPLWFATNAWEVSGMLSYGAYLQAPTATRRHQVMDWRLRRDRPWPWMYGGPYISLEWTGSKLIERDCSDQQLIDSIRTATVYVWQAGDPVVELAKRPFRAGCYTSDP